MHDNNGSHNPLEQDELSKMIWTGDIPPIICLKSMPRVSTHLTKFEW